MKYTALLLLLALLAVNSLSAEDGDILDRSVSLSISENVTLFAFGGDKAGTYDMSAEVYARAPRPCPKPFKLSTEVSYHISFDRKPVSGLRQLLDTLSPLTVLGVTFHYPLEKKDFALLPEFLPELLRLEFKNQMFEDSDFSEIANNGDLEELSFKGCTLPYSSVTPSLANLSRLRKLILIDCNAQKSVLASISQLKQVKAVELVSNDITDEMLEDLQKCSLSELRIASDNISDKAFSQFAFLKTLRRFAICGNNLTWASLRFIGRMPLLKDLEISGLSNIDAYVKLREAIQLRSLSISNTDMDDSGAEKLKESIHATELELINNPNITRKGYWRHIAPMICDSLHVDMSEQLSDGGLSLFASPVGLRELRLEKSTIPPGDFPPFDGRKNNTLETAMFSGTLYPYAFEMFVEFFPGIVNLNLSRSRFHGSRGDVALHQISRMKNLRRLSVGQVISTDFEWVNALSARRLNFLKLNEVTSVTDMTIGKFTDFKDLHVLDLRGNPSITSVGVKKLAEMEHLVCFNPTPCELIEEHEEAVAELLTLIHREMAREFKKHKRYFRNGMSCFPNVDFDIREDNFGYSFRYFSNSNVDDATKYLFLAFPNAIEEGSTIFRLTEDGVFRSKVETADDIENLKKLEVEEIEF